MRSETHTRTLATRSAAGLGSIALTLLVLAGASGVGMAAAGRPAVALRITVDQGGGHHVYAGLSCRGDLARGTGYLRASAAGACRRARGIAGFLASGSQPGRRCTQIYGGPETAVIRGAIGSRRIGRRFSRADGCGIADWARAGVLLPSSTFAP